MQNIYKHDKFHGKNIDIVARLYGVAACPFCQCKFQFDQPFIEPFILYCKNWQNARRRAKRITQGGNNENQERNH